jgi:hypothetical protein
MTAVRSEMLRAAARRAPFAGTLDKKLTAP